MTSTQFNLDHDPWLIQMLDSADLAQMPPNVSLNWTGTELTPQPADTWSWQLQHNVDGRSNLNGSASGPVPTSRAADRAPDSDQLQRNLFDEDDDEYSVRRREKNRVAQKAFRQRKEQYVKTLERKFNELESKSNSLEEENRRLKAELASLLPVQHQPGRDVLRDSLLDEPNQDSPLSEGTLNSDGRDYIRISQDARTKLVDSENTCQMISTVWELIQSNDLFEQREVDFVRVYEQLREIAGAQKQHFNLEDGIQKIFENAFPKEDSLL